MEEWMEGTMERRLFFPFICCSLSILFCSIAIQLLILIVTG